MNLYQPAWTNSSVNPIEKREQNMGGYKAFALLHFEIKKKDEQAGLKEKLQLKCEDGGYYECLTH